MIYLVGISIAFFLAALLLTKSSKKQADYILSIWLIYIGLHLFKAFVISTEGYEEHPYLMGLPLPLLHGPMLFFYTAVLTHQISFRKNITIHFLPFVLALLLMSPFYFLSKSEKIMVINGQAEGYEVEVAIVQTMILISGVIYVILSLWLLRKHAKTIRDCFSYADKINLNWLRYLIYGMGIVWLAVWLRNDQLIYYLVVVFVILLGYFGIQQVGIFSEPYPSYVSAQNRTYVQLGVISQFDNQIKNTLLALEKKKYEKSSLTESAAHEIHLRLNAIIENDKPYLNPELTLDELAEKVKIQPHLLSQVINTIEEKSFYDYINLKRVESFKKAVAIPENRKYTLLALAFECGFSSKTTFNRNFKNATGQTPSVYLKQLNVKLSPV